MSNTLSSKYCGVYLNQLNLAMSIPICGKTIVSNYLKTVRKITCSNFHSTGHSTSGFNFKWDQIEVANEARLEPHTYPLW